MSSKSRNSVVDYGQPLDHDPNYVQITCTNRSTVTLPDTHRFDLQVESKGNCYEVVVLYQRDVNDSEEDFLNLSFPNLFKKAGDLSGVFVSLASIEKYGEDAICNAIGRYLAERGELSLIEQRDGKYLHFHVAGRYASSIFLSDRRIKAMTSKVS